MRTQLLQAYLSMQGRVGAICLSTQQRLAVHLAPQAGDVSATEVFTQIADLLQLQQVNPENLNGLHHLITQAQGVTAVFEHRHSFSDLHSITAAKDLICFVRVILGKNLIHVAKCFL